MNTANDTLILASQSPRRARLLHDGGYRFIQATPPYADPAQPIANKSVNPELVVVGLALKKARSLLDGDTWRFGPESVILAADTVIRTPGGGLLGQPESRRDTSRCFRR